MQIIANVMRPCSRCYRIRQTFKDGMGRVFQRKATHTEYIVIWDTVITVDNETHKVVSVNYDASMQHLVGCEVYAAKGRLVDVETGNVVATFRRARKLRYVNGSETTV